MSTWEYTGFLINEFEQADMKRKTRKFQDNRSSDAISDFVCWKERFEFASKAIDARMLAVRAC